MFNKLKDYFQGNSSLEVDNSGEPTDRELQIATGVLLLEMAGADEDYAPSETKAIFRAIEKQFNIENTEAFEVLQAADAARSAAGKIDEFVNSLNDNFSPKQRTLVLAMIWKVILADYDVNKFEEGFANQMQLRLRLSDDEAAQAKTMAQRGEV